MTRLYYQSSNQHPLGGESATSLPTGLHTPPSWTSRPPSSPPGLGSAILPTYHLYMTSLNALVRWDWVSSPLAAGGRHGAFLAPRSSMELLTSRAPQLPPWSWIIHPTHLIPLYDPLEHLGQMGLGVEPSRSWGEAWCIPCSAELHGALDQ